MWRRRPGTLEVENSEQYSLRAEHAGMTISPDPVLAQRNRRSRVGNVGYPDASSEMVQQIRSPMTMTKRTSRVDGAYLYNNVAWLEGNTSTGGDCVL